MAKTPEIKLTQDYHRNYTINGNFDFWQRGTNVGLSSNAQYVADRFNFLVGGVDLPTISRQADVPTVAESKFASTYSMQVSPDTNYTVLASTDYASIRQSIEGFNASDLYGNTFTLSFWVKSSLAGTYCISLNNNNFSRSYIEEYTIDSANVWEMKSITIAHDNVGSWEAGSDRGIIVGWTLAAGSSRQGVEGWQGGSLFGTSNQVNFMADSTNTFKLSQVQITQGSGSLPFRRAGHNITEEFSLCQRYYQNLGDSRLVGAFNNTVRWEGYRALATPMRATPTITGGAEDPANWQVFRAPQGGQNWTPVDPGAAVLDQGSSSQSIGIRVQDDTTNHGFDHGMVGYGYVFQNGHLGLDAEI